LHNYLYAIARKMYEPPLKLTAPGAVLLISNPVAAVSI
jgi:hypothetical protein